MKKTVAWLLAASMMLSSLPASAFAATEFADMPSDYSTEALENAVVNGLLGGSNGNLLPDASLTRAEMAAILVRAFGAEVMADDVSFVDVDSADWFYDEVMQAVQMEVFQGDGDMMNPTDAISREEAFLVLYRAFALADGDVDSLADFSDADLVSSWAVDGVAAMVEAGYVQGSNGEINPLGNISRKDFAVTMNRMITNYISEAGTVTEIADGSVMIKTSDVTLKDVDVNGNLIIGDGVGDGEVTLDGILVSDKTIIRGGGPNSVYAENGSDLGDVVITNKNHAVSLKMSDDSTASSITIDSEGVTLSGVPEGVEIIVSENAGDATVNGEVVEAGETFEVEAESTSSSSGSSGGSSGGSSSSDSDDDTTSDADVATTEIAFGASTYSVTAGVALETSIVRNDGATDEVTYSSTDEEIATVDADGKISALQVGTVTITATAGDVSDTATVTITNPVSGAYEITEAGTILEGCTFTTLTIDENVDEGDYTLINCVVGELITNGGGANSGHLHGGVYNEISMVDTPDEGSRLALYDDVQISSIEIGDNAILESFDDDIEIETIICEAELNLLNVIIGELSTSSTVTTNAGAKVSVINATDEATIDAKGEVGTITGDAGTITLENTGSTLILATADTVAISGSTAATLKAAVDNVTIAADDNAEVTIAAGSPAVTTVSTDDEDAAVKSVKVEGDASPTITADNAITTITATGTSSPTIDGEAEVTNVITASTGSVIVNNDNVTAISATDATKVTGTASAVASTATVELTVKGIDVNPLPTTVYAEDATEFDPGNMEVVAVYTVAGFDGELTQYVEGYSTNWDTIDKIGDVDLTVSATIEDEEYTDTVALTFVAKEINSIFITSMPDKTIYDIGLDENKLDLEGMVITATYTNSKLYPNQVVSNYDVSNVDFTTVGTKTVTVTYEDETLNFTITVKDSVAEAKLEAIAEIESYWGSKLVAADYDDETIAEIKATQAVYVVYVNEATDVDALAGYIANAKASIDKLEAVYMVELEFNNKVAIAQALSYAKEYEADTFAYASVEDGLISEVKNMIATAINDTAMEITVNATYAETAESKTLTINKITLTDGDLTASFSLTEDNVFAVVQDVVETYVVDIADDMAHGSAYAEAGDLYSDSSSSMKVEAGETITLSYEAETGYTFEKYTVTANDEEIVVSANSTFVMPAADVLVSATFVASGSSDTNVDTDVSEYAVTSATFEAIIDGTNNSIPRLVFGEPANTSGIEFYNVKYYYNGVWQATNTVWTSALYDDQTWIDIDFASCDKVKVESCAYNDDYSYNVLGTAIFEDISITNTRTETVLDASVKSYTANGDNYDIVLTGLTQGAYYIAKAEYSVDYSTYYSEAHGNSPNGELQLSLTTTSLQGGTFDLVQVTSTVSEKSVEISYSQIKTLSTSTTTSVTD